MTSAFAGLCSMASEMHLLDRGADMGLFTILKDIAKAKVARKLMRGGLGRAFLITYVAKKGYDLYRSRQRRRLGYT